MLDIKALREHSELVQQGAKDKGFKVDIKEILAIDDHVRQIQRETEDLQAERNAASKAIPQASPTEREALKAKVQALKPLLEQRLKDLDAAKAELQELMLKVPQPAAPDVPIGPSDKENVQIKTWGKIPEFSFKPLDHIALGLKHHMIDVERGVRLAGSRSYYLRGPGAILEQALFRYAFDRLLQKGYEPMSVPVLVREEAMVGTGYFPGGRDQAYTFDEDKLALVGTGEVPLAYFHTDEILAAEDLPIRLSALSPCFRREAGTYGKDTHGLYRVHQFTKIEQVIIGPPDDESSAKLHQELLGNAEELLQNLGLAYRVVYVCTGDLGQGQYRKHDIETWMPSRQAYSETHSCSSFRDYQARRLKIRTKGEDGKTIFCHTLNNTLVASPRILIPLMESYQEADGRIRIPEVLRSYMGGQAYIG